MLLIVGLITAEIALRTLFSVSLPFAWEYSAYALGGLIFAGLGWTLRTGGHIRVTAAYDRLPAILVRATELAAAGIGTMLAVMLAWTLTALCIQSYIDGTRSFLVSETPLFIPQIAIALGAIGLALQMGLRFLLLAIGDNPERKMPESETAQLHL